MLKPIIPNLSVDCVIFGFDSKELNVLLVERKLTDTKDNSLIFSDFTLTGNHVHTGEDPDDAAVRVLNDLIGSHNIYLEQFHTFGGISRLSKKKDKLWINNLGLNISEQVITIGYYSLIDSSSVKITDHQSRNVKWFPVNQLPELGFDHYYILQKALACLQLNLKQEPIGFELLAEKFTLTQVQRLYEAIMGTKLDTRNFRKKLSQVKYIIPLDEKQQAVRHKPAQLFKFSREIYEKSPKERYGYII